MSSIANEIASPRPDAGPVPANLPPTPTVAPSDAARVGELILSIDPEQLVIMLSCSGLTPEECDDILEFAVAHREAV
jgi:hypothetical protein